MIKSDKGTVQIEGKTKTILAEFVVLVHGLKESLAEKSSEDYAEYLIISNMMEGLKIKVEKKKEKKDDLMERVDKIIDVLEKELTDGRDED